MVRSTVGHAAIKSQRFKSTEAQTVSRRVLVTPYQPVNLYFAIEFDEYLIVLLEIRNFW